MLVLGPFWLVDLSPHCGSYFPVHFLLDIRHCKVYLVGCWIVLSFCNYSWALFWDTSYWETGFSFWVLRLRHVRWDSSCTNSELIFPLCWGETLLFILPIVPWILTLSSLADGHRQNLWPSVSAGHVLSYPFECVFQPQVVYSHTCTGQSAAEFPRDTLCRSLESSVCAGLTSLALCPMSSRFLGLNTLGSVFRNLVRWLGSIWVSLPRIGAWTLKDISWAVEVSPCLFLISQGSLTFITWCTVSHKPLFHILLSFFCFRWESKSNSCYSILLRSRSFRYEGWQIS